MLCVGGGMGVVFGGQLTTARNTSDVNFYKKISAVLFKGCVCGLLDISILSVQTYQTSNHL